MYTFEIFLTLLSISGFLGTPFYLYFRSKMVKNDFTYSKKHIFKVIFLHMAAMLVITILHALILFSILKEVENISTQKLQYFIFQNILLGVALYGGGIYIACVLLEHFTTHITKKVLYFKNTLRFLHGPLSHVLFEVAYMLAFWNIALIQSDLGLSGTIANSSFFILIGALTGVAFSLATIGNGTYLIYLVSSIASLPFFFKLITTTTTGGIYAWGFMFSSISLCVAFTVARLLKRKTVKFYQPINFF